MGFEVKRGAIVIVFACLALIFVFNKHVLVFFEQQREITKEPAAQATHEPNVATIPDLTDRSARVPMCSLLPQKGKRRKTSATAASSAWDVFGADEREFVKLASPCTDKTTWHKYQHMYARMLYQFKHSAASATEAKPFKMLEIGLGCNMRCVAGGFRLFRDYLPNVQYHAFESNYSLCRSGFRRSGLSGSEGKYLDAHVCEGSSENPADLDKCAKRFGPFDLIVDDASHMQAHIIAAFTHLFPSEHLKRGGVYVIEDLQVGYHPNWGGSEKEQTDGLTAPEMIKELLDWKLASNPTRNCPIDNKISIGGRRRWSHVVPEIAGMMGEMLCSHESCGFVKR